MVAHVAKALPKVNSFVEAQFPPEYFQTRTFVSFWQWAIREWAPPSITEPLASLKNLSFESHFFFGLSPTHISICFPSLIYPFPLFWSRPVYVLEDCTFLVVPGKLGHPHTPTIHCIAREVLWTKIFRELLSEWVLPIIRPDPACHSLKYFEKWQYLITTYCIF